MSEPNWLSLRDIVFMHDQQLLNFGGLPGVRDMNAVESALARPKQKLAYETPDLADLAAAYGFGLAKNHGFSDGNKRIAFAALTTFLKINGQQVSAPEAEATAVILGVASGELGEAELAVWIRRSMTPRGAPAPR